MRPFIYLVALVTVFILAAFACGADAKTIVATAATMLIGLGSVLQIADVNLKVTKALPNGAATITSDGIDLGHSTRGDHLAMCSLVLNAPACTTGELGDTQTLTYSIEHDDASDFSGVATLFSSVIVQTGAGGAGAVAAEKEFTLPPDVKRYVRAKCVKTGATNASTASLTLALKF